MINCIIVDDEPSAIEVIQFHLDKVPFAQLLNSFRSPLDALEYLQKNQVDLIFLDINMPELSGISFSQLLRNPPLIVFTTAYSEYALQSYELDAIDYLLKPIVFDRFLKAMMKAKNALITRQHKMTETSSEVKTLPSSMYVKSGSKVHQIFFDDIKYLESEGNYVTINTISNAIVVRSKLSEIMDLIPANLFVRIHRSYAISLQHLETISKSHVIIKGDKIPISAGYRKEFFAKLGGDLKK